MSANAAAASPYKGLEPFDDTELDALMFFGRERERDVIVANLMAARLTVLYGPSGVGKSSLLRAGVAYHLRQRSRSGEGFAVLVFDRWSGDPLNDLTETVDSELGRLVDDPSPTATTLVARLEEWSARLGGDIYLIFDQFDEYFLYRDRFPRDEFAETLPELVNRRGLRTNVLVSIREDAVASLDAFKARIPNLFANYLRLDHLDRDAGRAAIVGPIERFAELTGREIAIEPELVETVLDEVATGRVDLGGAGRGGLNGESVARRIEAAYLQLVMERLWEAEHDAGSDVLRLETLRLLGGANEIVRVHLERAVEPLTAAQQDLAAGVFHHLVTPSGTKIAHALPDLAGYASIPQDDLVPVLGELGRARILRTVNGTGAQARYEIFHDVLAAPVLAWRAQRRIDRERREADRRHRRAVAFAAAALGALAVVTAIAVFALVQRERARDSARRAHARELAAQASVVLESDPVRSVALAARAARLEPSPYVERQLRNSIIASRLRELFQARGGEVTDAVTTPDNRRIAVASAAGWIRVFDRANGRMLAEFRHPGHVFDLVVSRDGRTLVSGGGDSAARIWRLDGGQPPRVLGHRGAVTSVSLSGDGRWVVTGSRDRRARVWNVASGALLSHVLMDKPVTLARFSPASDRVAAVSGGRVRVFDPLSGQLLRSFRQRGTIGAIDFSKNGRLIATAGADRVARIWSLDPFKLLHELRGHDGQVVDVSFSPRGNLLATASTDGTARAWTVGRGTPAATMLGHRNFVNSARFSPDGFYIITASRDRTARVWVAESGKTHSILSGHRDSVTLGTFVSGSRLALTRSDDGTARIWDTGTEPELRLLGRHRSPVTSVAFDRSGRAVLSAGTDGTARVWRDAAPVRRFAHGASITDAAYSSAEQLVITAGTDGVARVWSPNPSLRRVISHGARINAIATTSDTRQLATAGQDGFVRVWSLDSGRPVRSLRHRAPVLDVAFDPAGGRLATAGADGIARIWSGSKLQHELNGHTDDVTAIAFGRGGGFIATASRDNDLRLWNAGTGRTVRVLEGHFGGVSDVAFSSDGRWIASAGPSAAGLWEVRSGISLPFLRGHAGILNSIAFAPATHRIVTGGDDGTVRTYSCEVCGNVPALVRLAERRLADAQAR